MNAITADRQAHTSTELGAALTTWFRETAREVLHTGQSMWHDMKAHIKHTFDPKHSTDHSNAGHGDDYAHDTHRRTNYMIALRKILTKLQHAAMTPFRPRSMRGRRFEVDHTYGGHDSNLVASAASGQRHLTHG